MTSLFPNSNLSTGSQPWGREVEKRLVNLDLTVKSNEINNSARDTQLSNSLKRVNTALVSAQSAADEAGLAAAKAQSIIDNIYVTGTEEIDGAALAAASLSGAKLVDGTVPGGKLTANTITASQIATNYVYAGTINAGQITAGTITGDFINGGTITGTRLKTAASGERVEIGVDTFGAVSFYTSAGKIGSIYAFSFNDGGGTNNWINIDSPFTYVAGYMSVSGAVNLSTTLYTGGAITTAGSITAVGSISTDGGLTRTIYSGGGTTGASINNNGTIIRTTSSARYKQDISSLEFNYEDILALEPKKFRLKDEVVDSVDARYYAGFIAEEIAETPLDLFVGYQKLEDGSTRPDSVYYPELTTALLSAIKHQDGIIKNLTSRLETLENK
jgi:hypothetical protein